MAIFDILIGKCKVMFFNVLRKRMVKRISSLGGDCAENPCIQVMF